MLTIVGEASCLVFPSTCYETFGRTVPEAYAKGTPVIVSRGGATAELVDEGRTGLLFDAGNAADLAQQVIELTSDPQRLASMRRAAREEFESKYTADRGYQGLMKIYRQAMAGQRTVPTAGREQGDECCSDHEFGRAERL